MVLKHWEERVCESCKKSFMFRRCYAARPGTPGRFCSNKCRYVGYAGAGNPNATGLAAYPEKVARHIRQQKHHAKLKKLALDKIGQVYCRNPVCFGCGCIFVPALQINHKVRFKTKEYGATLQRLVLRASPEEILKEYDIRCVVCNWAYFAKIKFGLDYKIYIKGEGH